MSAATAASGLQAALGAVKQEVARGGEKEAAPAADAELPAQPDGDRPSLSVSPPKDPPVSILGLQKQYQELEKQYDVLLAREEYMHVEVLDGEAAPHTISGVDFARPLAPLPAAAAPLASPSAARAPACRGTPLPSACAPRSLVYPPSATPASSK